MQISFASFNSTGERLQFVVLVFSSNASVTEYLPGSCLANWLYLANI